MVPLMKSLMMTPGYICVLSALSLFVWTETNCLVTLFDLFCTVTARCQLLTHDLIICVVDLDAACKYLLFYHTSGPKDPFFLGDKDVSLSSHHLASVSFHPAPTTKVNTKKCGAAAAAALVWW